LTVRQVHPSRRRTELNRLSESRGPPRTAATPGGSGGVHMTPGSHQHGQRYCRCQALGRASPTRRPSPPRMIALLHHAMGHDPGLSGSPRGRADARHTPGALQPVKLVMDKPRSRKSPTRSLRRTCAAPCPLPMASRMADASSAFRDTHRAGRSASASWPTGRPCAPGASHMDVS
jgi:hypothetical protein